jgi:dihydroneopterin aldolase
VDLVVKLGGGLLPHLGAFEAALAAIRKAARVRRLLIVPGGGPFADVVRDVHRQHRLSETAAHWMAVLGMDQYAHLIVSRLPGSVLVRSERGIADALSGSLMPVLAPSQWLRQADPLPHSWDVTSDSIAAWVAGQLGARRLILIKPPAASGGTLVDPFFARALPPGVTAETIAGDALQARPGLLTAQSPEQ